VNRTRGAAYRDALVGAFTDAEGTLISGGTGQGVSSLAADVSSAVESVRSVGYLPAALPEGVEEDARYDELRRSDGDAFGPAEPLAYWRDLIDEGCARSTSASQRSAEGASRPSRFGSRWRSGRTWR
jgi:hypothetical protein